jgi:hypothetical protein
MEEQRLQCSKRRLTAVGTRCADHATSLYPQNLALTSRAGGVRLVGIVRMRTEGHGGVLLLFCLILVFSPQNS